MTVIGLEVREAADPATQAALDAGGWNPPAELRATVAAIVDEVRARGDAAVLEYTRRFDFADARAAGLRVALPSLAQAARALPSEVVSALRLARERVYDFHERQRAGDREYLEADGTRSALLVQPLDAVGAYVPGGRARLPSSVIMTVVPAKVAGVHRVAVASPPRSDGTLDPATIFAAVLAGADELYAVGGAQAIAAFAFGTRTLARVAKIVGPGNAYVTEAKRQVYGICGIDGLAGPSEVLVAADDASDPELVAGELLAQAEHDPLARVCVVSTSRRLLERVAALLRGSFAREAGRSEIIEAVLAERTLLVHAHDRAELLAAIARYAPEHLALLTSDAQELAQLVRNAGAIFVGPHSPVAAGDYLAGSNHVLPTSGAPRFASGLRTADFVRTVSLIENSPARIAADAPAIAALAEFEGLPNHARSARLRMRA
ncbi:MAG: histidinol dehydrogenase [Vulcanimicrobiaceae bacterium]